MNRILFSISLALLIHGILLFGDFSRLQLFSAANPTLQSIDMTLMAYSPPPQPQIPLPPAKNLLPDKVSTAPEKLPELLPVPQEEMPLPAEISEPPIAAPPPPNDAAAEPEAASEAVMESEFNESAVERQLLESLSEAAEAVVKTPPEATPLWRKPKRNLKALTKVAKQAIAAVERTLPAKPPKSKPPPKKAKLPAKPLAAAKEKPKPKPVKAESSAPATESPQKPSVSQADKTMASSVSDMADAVASLNKQTPTAQIVLAKPLYRHNPPPKYPKRARRKGLQGIVVLEVLVDETGQVEELTVFTSSGHKVLDKAARKSVKKWLFQPGTKGGKIAKMWVRVPIRFKLNQ